MPADAASSSSEDEGNDSSSPGSTPAKQSKQATKKSTRYQCPADFVTFRHQPCSSTLKANLMVDNTELWLIKAPASFNPKCFNNVKVPISGLQTIKASSTVGEDEGGCHQIYSVLASAHGVSALHLLTSDSKSANKVACAPAFRGLLNVCESYGDCSSNQAPQAIPAAPAPCIPLGLKLRFQPFGSKTPTVSTLEDSESLGDCEEEPDPLAAVAGTLDGTMWTASSATLPPLLPPTITQRLKEERKKKKKKRKRDKRMEEDEKEAVVMVKMEPAFEVPNQEALTGEKRKKKKKKKDREKGEAQEDGMMTEVKEEVEVKEEPIDVFCTDLVDSGKKKKNKKKSKHNDD